MIRDWPVISRKQVGDFGLFSLTKKKVRSPRTGEIREVQALQFADWVLILALTAQEEVVMVRQYRHGTEQVCLELPGGLVDAGDDSPHLDVVHGQIGGGPGRRRCFARRPRPRSFHRRRSSVRRR